MPLHNPGRKYDAFKAFFELTILAILVLLQSCTEAPLFELPKDFNPEYQKISSERLDKQAKKRLRAKISLRPGLSKSAVELNIKHYIQNKFSSTKDLKAITVWVYRTGDTPIDLETGYTVAMGTWAPNGEFYDIKSDPEIRENKLVLSFNDTYFNPVLIKYSVGDTFLLHKNKSLSASADSWRESIYKTKTDETAKVIQVKVFNGTGIVRYQVSVNNHVGWLNQYEISD